MGTAVEHLPLADLVQRARALAASGDRAVLGITGAPGAGKSTLAAALHQALEGAAVVLPMDGFHLDDRVLDALGRRDRKGAPDTFDAAGFVHLLRRMHARTDEVVYAPVFLREREQAVAGALPIPPDVPLVVTEGNYLLCDGAFGEVREQLTQSWYLDLDPAVRLRRLIDRHVRHGRSPEAAERWARGTDERNAELVETSRARADLVVRLVEA